jgi:nicotinamide-nucleotide amidase
MYNTKEITGIKNYMLKHRQTLAVAESVTSGHLQAALSLAVGASEFFQGGITAYNIGQKSRHLKVNAIHALSTNCVSKRVSEEMALNAIAFFSSDWAIGITGYAAPVPELNINDLFAFYAIAYEGEIVISRKISASDEGQFAVQVLYTDKVLKEMSKYLKNL